MTNQPGDDRSQIRLASGLNIIAGLWLIISPWVFFYATPGGIWNSVIVGIIIAVLAAIRAFGAYNSAWMSWVNVVLGLWVVIAPFIFGYTTYAGRMWNNIIVGLIVAALGAWSAMATNRAHHV